MNESLIKHAFFKPCFDTQPMAFPSEVSYSPAAPYRPFPWPSSTQLLCILLHRCLHQNNPSTMQYNWLESETQCALMHSGLNSLRDRLWFNQLKDTETWSWNAMLRITYLFLLPLLPVHHSPHITSTSAAFTTSATFTSVKRNIALNSFSCTFYSMRIFLNLTANIMILGTYTHFS